MKQGIACGLSWLLALSSGYAQEAQVASPPPVIQESPSKARAAYLSSILNKYQGPEIAPVNLRNTSRLEELLQDGKIYLSLQDAIALALENNLDIELERYEPVLAKANLLRAQAGGPIRGLPQSIQTGPSSAQDILTGGVGNGFSNSGGGGSVSTGNALIVATGVSIPTFDESLTFFYDWSHSNLPSTNTVVAGVTTSRTSSQDYDFSFSKAFATGTSVQTNWTNTSLMTNSPNNPLNPATQSRMTFQVSQRLLQGRGIGLNTRNIRIAKIGLQISDLVFRQQVIATVLSVVNLYHDLVGFNEQVKVRRLALEAAEKLYNDNRKQVEIGTLARIEIARAELEVARTRQDVLLAETQVMQQETILKNVLSRTGIASPSISDARLIPTDTFKVPPVEPVAPIQDLIGQALRNRLELAQTRLNLESARIGLQGSKNALLPALDAFVNTQPNAYSGSVNTIPVPGTTNAIREVNPALVGGFGNLLGQLFGFNYANYTAGFQLTVPLRNRAATADLINDTVSLRQAELKQQQEINRIRVDVKNALIGMQQGRANYEVAQQARRLGETNLEAEQKKYILGASTVFNVVQAQRDLAQAQTAEVQAIITYSRAQAQLDYALGTLLDKYEVSIAEAEKGKVVRPSTPAAH